MASGLVYSEDKGDLLIYNFDSTTCHNTVIMSQLDSIFINGKSSMKDKQKEVTYFGI